MHVSMRYRIMLRHVEKFSRDISKQKGIVDPVIKVEPGSKKGDGFLGDILIVTITNGVVEKKLSLIIKCATTDDKVVEKYHISDVYANEYNFYDRIFPTFNRFQEEKHLEKPFKSIPLYYGSYFEADIRLIAMENLRIDGFQLFDKKGLVDESHIEKVFQEYGKFHALSVAYRNQHPEEFEHLTNALEDIWAKFCEDEGFTNYLTELFKKINDIVMNLEEESILTEFKKYEDTGRIFTNVYKYRGSFPVLTHGDNWTNNFMFKYAEDNGQRKVEAVRILDWQLIRIGSPVYDLSYFLYSSASQPNLDRLDHFLRIYHETYSSTMKQLGEDPENIYPFSMLQKEWKKYAKFGFILGCSLQRTKLTNNDDIVDLHDIKDSDPDETTAKFLAANFDEDAFTERMINLVRHVNSIGVL